MTTTPAASSPSSAASSSPAASTAPTAATPSAAGQADVRRHAGWLPEQEGLEAWLRGHRERAGDPGSVPLHPAVAELAQLLRRDPVLRMQVERMIEEVPSGRDYAERHVNSTEELLHLLSAVMETAPTFSTDSMVMTPIGAVLDWTTGTPSGFAAYRNPAMNDALRRILRAWCDYLNSPASLKVLNDSDEGWMGRPAREAVGMEQFEHDPTAEHWGFTSWNDFFIRRFKDGQRPVGDPDDDRVVVAACESTPYGFAQGVSRTDHFWAKGKTYSLQDLMADDPSVDAFVGGTVWQAYLSATNYHRWHAPVSGTVVRAFVVEGTFYSEADSTGADAVVPQDSQTYLAHVAARAILLIEADRPGVGVVAVVAVGMSDVSSCVLGETIKPGVRVTKGQEVGHFAFGGSTHCLVFEPGAVVDVAAQALPRPGDPEAPLVQVRSRIMTLR